MDRKLSRKSIMVTAGTVVFGVLTFGMLVLTMVSDRGLLEVRKQSFRLGALETEIADLEAANEALNEEIRILRTDPAEIERRAREDLKLVRPGEVVIMVPDR